MRIVMALLSAIIRPSFTLFLILSMKEINKVLITGVAGFIGSNLLDYLLAKTSWHITGVDNFITGNKKNIEGQLQNRKFKFIEGSVGEIKSLKDYDCIF